MDCPSCAHPNPPEARFCGGCGAPLRERLRCPGCGAENPAGQRHCNACGRQLSAAGRGGDATAAPEAPESRPDTPEHLAAKIRAGATALEGERKQITVMFADIVRSMELAASVEAERWRAILDRFLAIASHAVHSVEGTVPHFTGDGVMALFGAPLAHEDHARRACLAALELQRELAPFSEQVAREDGIEFQIRCGLNSGEVIIGSIGEDLQMDYTAIGHTVGLAERTQQLAEPGTALVTEHTAALVEGYMELVDLGEHEPKGAGGSLRVYELTGPGRAIGRVSALGERGLSRFVGREPEMRNLEEAREQALAGLGQVVGIVGDPGVGKSRLCHEFAERCRARGMPVYHAAGQAHARSVPLMPVLQFLRAFFEIGERDPDRMARARIGERLRSLDSGLGEELPLLFDFLAVTDPERPAERMDPEARQRRLLALMRRLARAQSAREPGVLLFEDLQWIDPASEVFLANHVEALQGTRSLAVVDFRPEYRAGWMSHSYYRQIALAPLGAEATERLLADLLGSDRSLEGLSEMIGERTEGNPFFVEEIVNSLVEDGSLVGKPGAYRLVRTVDWEAVPASVQAVLAARIDRLQDRDKGVLGAASVIGREFSASVLERVAGLAPEELAESLGGLVAGEFVHEREVYPESTYLFKHPLTQQVAYRSQLAERRRAMHARVAEAISSSYPERLDERAGLVAGHWEEADEQLEAARWHARAGAWAGTSDPGSAHSHWQQVRDLADALPESQETAALGLGARTFLVRLGWRLGISREEADALFGEAERMAARAGDIRSRALLLANYSLLKAVGDGELRQAARLERQAIALAEEAGDPALYLAVANPSYAPLFLIGEYREALAVADRGIELAAGDPTVGADLSFANPYALCHAWKGFTLAYLGELEEAGRLIARGREIASEQGDALMVGWTHFHSSGRGYLMGEPESAHGHAERGVEIAERIGDSFSRSWAWFFLGVAERLRGRWRPAIDALERSQAISRESRTGAESIPMRLAFLAESHLGLGDAERARDEAAKGAEIAAAQGNVFGELVTSLAQARVLLGSGGPAARARVEATLASVLELAGRTGARAFEPMVHVELGELALQSGDREGRREQLREAHRLFTEIGAGGHAERLAGEPALSTG